MKTKAKIIATDSLGARSVEIKTRNALIYTPTRAVTSTELRYVPDIVKAGYNNVVFPSQIVELILDFRDKSDRDAILRSNTAFASRIRNIRTLVSKADEKVTILRPAVRPNDVISSEFIEATIQAGVESGCTKISVLDTSRLMSADDQVKLLNRMEKFASGFSATLDRKIELMPSIRINVDDVRTLTNRIRAIKDMGYDELNVILASYADYSRNYMEFRKRCNKNEMWIHASETKRVWGTDEKRVSWMHALQFFGMDTFALQLPHCFAPSAPRDSVHDKPISEVKLFDSNTIGVMELAEFIGRYGDRIKSASPIFHGRKFEEFAPAMRHKKILDQACKIDESLSSHAEFAKGREFIRKQEAKNYTESKEYLRKAVQEVLTHRVIPI